MTGCGTDLQSGGQPQAGSGVAEAAEVIAQALPVWVVADGQGVPGADFRSKGKGRQHAVEMHVWLQVETQHIENL
jgi:hypothetical protein